jgi:hypothetical protein
MQDKAILESEGVYMPQRAFFAEILEAVYESINET